MEEVATNMAAKSDPVLMVGGFQSGHFSKEALSLSENSYRIQKESLEAWTVVSRAIYDYEKATGLEKN